MSKTEKTTLEDLRHNLPSHLEITEINSNYPSSYPDDNMQSGNAPHAITGFSSMSECKEFANEYDLDIHEFETKNGYSCIGDRGLVNGAFNVTDIADCYCDSNIISQQELDDLFKDEEISQETFDILSKELQEGEVMCLGDYNNLNYEVYTGDIMVFEEDLKYHYIGVLVPADEIEENEENETK
ncbi:MAG TPA: hypothetical protein PL089_15435 [Ignavibacteria bacterium]|nr:hypothetical protein [Ignavibacteria bacterium]